MKGIGYYKARAVPAIVLILLLFLIPVVSVFISSGSGIFAVIRDESVWRILLFTLQEALLSALVSTLIALPFAAFFSKYDFPGRKAILALSGLSFTMPTILTVLGFVIWYGNNGYLNNMLGTELRILYSFKAIILAHVYLNFPIAFLLITSAWTSRSEIEEKASYALGKGRLATFLRITLPATWGSIASAFIMIFLFCFSSFAIVMVLGGHPRYYTLEAEIYRRVYIDADIPSAAALSIFTLAVTSFLLFITSRGRKEQKAHKAKQLMKAKGSRLAIAIALMALILLFLLPPILSIVARSFISRDGEVSLASWEKALSIGRESIAMSFIIASVSSLLAVSLATSVALYTAKRNLRLLPFLTALPMAAGSVTIGLGMLEASAMLPSVLRPVSVLLAHTVIILPFAVRTIVPGAMGIPSVLTSASYALGVSERKTLRSVELPILRPYRRKALCFAFALSLGEVNATLMISLGRITTLPVLIYDLIGRYDYQSAAALGTVLLLEALVIFTISEVRNGISGNQ